MPRRLIRALAYHRPGPLQRDRSLPTREMWVDSIPDGVTALASHPLFQLAPIGDELKAQMLHPDRQRRILKEGRLTRGGPVEVLIWHPIGWRERTDYVLARTPDAFFCPYRPQDARNRFTPYDHWVCATRDRVWEASGGDRDSMALGAYVHLMERLDFLGYRLPLEPQGPIPPEDDEALGDLAP